MKVLREWFINAPWGKIALISWGDPNGEPILLVHGLADSAATFIPLLELLPDRYHYVGVDLPGHGKSDALPIGVTVARIHFLGALQTVVAHLRWNNFLFLAHSMGCELGLFFNAVCPGIVKGLVLLDVAIPLYTIHVYDHNKHFESFYQNYYDEYKKQNVDDRVYTKRKAKDAVMVARKLTDEQAELVLSRNLVKIGDDQYRLSWDRRLRFPATTNYPVEYNYQIFKHLPPTIIFKARLSTGYLPGEQQFGTYPHLILTTHSFFFYIL
ncbi:serine hydrolase-like protein [Aphomia sociella]